MAYRGQDPLLQLGRIHAGRRRRLFALFLGSLQTFPREFAGVHRPCSTAGRQFSARRSAWVAGTDGHVQRATRIRKFLPHPGHTAVDWPPDERRRRPGKRTAGCGDELSNLANEVWLGPFRSRRKFHDQRAPFYCHRRHATRVLWSQAVRLGHAGLLDLAHLRKCYGGCSSAAQTREWKLS